MRKTVDEFRIGECFMDEYDHVLTVEHKEPYLIRVTTDIYGIEQKLWIRPEDLGMLRPMGWAVIEIERSGDGEEEMVLTKQLAWYEYANNALLDIDALTEAHPDREFDIERAPGEYPVVPPPF